MPKSAIRTLRKAFDKIDIEIVLAKIKALGINGQVYAFIKAFLMEREQAVCVKGHFSKFRPVISGVPQGSALGPLIFLIMIGDIDGDLLNSLVSSFADDTRASKKIKTQSDSVLLQNDLNYIYNWSQKSNAALNGDKFQLLRDGDNDNLKSTNYITPNGLEIEPKLHVKDLGILMSANCTFDEYILKVVSNAKSISSWILRTFASREINGLAYIRVLQCPLEPNECQIQQIELLQQSFIRKIQGVSALNYWEALDKLNLYSLQRRRKRYLIIYIWKVLKVLF